MYERRPRVYRVKAVAEMFDVSVATIYRAIEAGQLNALKLGNGRGTLRVPESALVAFAKACGRADGAEQRSDDRTSASASGRAVPDTDGGHS